MNVEYRQADAQTDQLGGPFDVAISRFGTMFFDDPAAAFENIARHLSPAGRLCIVTWQPLEANQWLVVPGAALLGSARCPTAPIPPDRACSPKSDPANVHRTLAAAGFADISTEPHTLAMHLGATIADAVDYLADSGPGRAILETIPPERHDDALAAVADALRPHHEPDHGVMLEAAVLLTTARTTP